MKGDLIKDFHDLLIASTFDQQDFETRLSYEFFKYSFQLFSLSIHTSHIDWLMNRIRPLQFKNKLLLDTSTIHSHSSFKIFKSLYNLFKLATKSDFSKLSSLLILSFKSSKPINRLNCTDSLIS